jgi:hypothetical protein
VLGVLWERHRMSARRRTVPLGVVLFVEGLAVLVWVIWVGVS